MKKIILILLIVFPLFLTLSSCKTHTPPLFFNSDDDTYGIGTVCFDGAKFNIIKIKGYDEIFDYHQVNNGSFYIAVLLNKKGNTTEIKSKYLVLDTKEQTITKEIEKDAGMLTYSAGKFYYLRNYYTSANNFDLICYNYKKDSSRIIIEGISKYCIINEKIYYIKKNSLYSLYDDKKLLSDCFDLTGHNDCLIVCTTKGVYKYDPQKKFTKPITKKKYNLYCKYDDNSVVVSSNIVNKNDELEYSIFDGKDSYYLLYFDGKKQSISYLKNKIVFPLGRYETDQLNETGNGSLS